MVCWFAGLLCIMIKDVIRVFLLLFFVLLFFKQHANNNVQRLLLANKCDAEDERRVWKDQGARVSTEKCFFK